MPEIKGKSPFYPGQPIPPEFFTGRTAEIDRLKVRCVNQVAAGKPIAVFIQGEYGIGKSSVANYVRAVAETESSLHGVYVTLDISDGLEDVAAAILEGVVNSGAQANARGEAVRKWLMKYIKEVKLFGISVNVEVIKKDASDIATPLGILNLLREAVKQLGPAGVTGIVLILDEINGISGNPVFAHFLKALVDTNAFARPPLPLLLMLCGTEARRNDIIRNHPPVGRIFGVVPVEPMSVADTRDFFRKAFESVRIEVDPGALDNLVYFSGGLPKIMHEIGDAAFYSSRDGRINRDDALNAVQQAADEVGRKYVEPEVVAALRSKSYHSILEKLSKLHTSEFTRDELAADLTEEESRKLDHFLRRLRKLHVIRAGEIPGEYLFNVKLYQVYLTLKAYRPAPRDDGPRHG